MSAELLESRFPEFCNAIKNMVLYDKKVEDWIIKKYGSDTIEHLIAFNDYNKQMISNDNSDIIHPNIIKFAKKKKALFEKFQALSYQVYSTEGFQNAQLYSEFMHLHYKQMSNILL